MSRWPLDGAREGGFRLTEFFVFSVRRNSVGFASPRGRKSLVGPRFVSGGEAIFNGFRLGGWTKAPRAEASCVMERLAVLGALCSYGCAAPTFGRGCRCLNAAPNRPKVGATLVVRPCENLMD